MSSGNVINIGAFHAHESLAGTTFPDAWVKPVDKEELLDAHKGWETEVLAILNVSRLPCFAFFFLSFFDKPAIVR